ncbi:secondary thiamine-phosphate synthase enzyme YjbQ [Spirochaeta dissipatitropha]
MQITITFPTDAREGLYDITDLVQGAVADSGIDSGLCSVYAQGATAAIMIQENWDDSVQSDVIRFLQNLIPRGVWEHDARDMHEQNGDSHLKAGLIGPSESIPLIGGMLGLSRWQNIFFCEFDGPRSERRVVVSVIEA